MQARAWFGCGLWFVSFFAPFSTVKKEVLDCLPIQHFGSDVVAPRNGTLVLTHVALKAS